MIDIDAEFEKFFEFPTADRSTVSSVSCKLFARHVAEIIATPNDEPAAWCSILENGHIRLWHTKESVANGYALADGHKLTPLYLRPQPAIDAETKRIRAEALQDAAAYVLANAKIKNSCCSETRANIYVLIKGMGDDH